MVRASGALTVANSTLQDAYFDGILGAGPTVVTNTVLTGADRGIVVYGNQVDVVNCTLDNNRIGILTHSGSLTMVNTIVTNSLVYGMDWNLGDTAPVVRYSNVWGSGTADFHNHFGAPDPTPGTDGIISADPLYVDSAAGIFELGAGSPALDAADSFVSPASDMEGRARFNDTGTVDTGIGPLPYVDMGALERWHVQTDVDLVVTNLQAVLLPNRQIQLDVTIANQGTEDAPGGWVQRLLLQQYDPTNSLRKPAPYVIGEAVQTQPLSAGGTMQVRVVLPMVTVPSGDYQAGVVVDATNQIYEQPSQGDFNNTYYGSAVVKVNNPDLVVGTVVSGDWHTDGTDLAYDVTVDPGTRVQIAFASPETPADIFYSSGTMPEPLDYQQHAFAGGAIVVANAGDQPAVGVVRVQAQAAPGGSSPFSLTTSLLTNGVTSVSPASGGNAGQVTVMISGGLFADDTTFALRPSGSPGAPSIQASKIKVFDGRTTVAATFNLTGAATGSYDVLATWTGTAATLAGAFNVTSGGSSQFNVELVGPDLVRPDRQLPYKLVWSNTGTNDIAVQYLTVTMPSGVHIAQNPNGKERMDHVELLTFTATTSDYAILPPGSSGQLDLWLTFESVHSQYNVDMNWTPIDDPFFQSTPVDWDKLLSDAKPPNVDGEVWNNVVDDVKSNVGEDWGQVIDVLIDDAAVDGLNEGLNQGNAANAIKAGASQVGKLVADQVGKAFDRQPVRPGGDGVHRDWVIIVAVEDYRRNGPGWNNLSGTQKDATALLDYFQNNLWIPSSQITVLRDRANSAQDDISTLAQIRDAWRQTAARADADDKIKFTFSGHGGYLPVSS